MTIRVLRLIEYVYPDAESCERDMANWTHRAPAAAWKHGMAMRSVALPFEVLDQTPEWAGEDA
jgi:hypothetical protein